ncbi:unnamed protein product [Anisakis simplex]|uniref:E3 ubiquitin-protein ligase (inferred by orthology to a S. mansoni protein) n=1 Tax=Anisakis simplex TaxID=6269 RepID=A0A0M3JXB0_ANISI|nr:unnamed protein product [Anisakis simplex]
MATENANLEQKADGTDSPQWLALVSGTNLAITAPFMDGGYGGELRMPSQHGLTDERLKVFPLHISIISAKLQSVGGIFSKPPDVYVELSVDRSPSKKTAVKKKTSTPQWDEQLQVQVNESSLLDFRVFNKSKVFEDSLIGQKTLKLSNAIRKESDGGKFENTKITLQLTSPKDSAVKSGELKIALTGYIERTRKKSAGFCTEEIDSHSVDDVWPNGLLSVT